MELKEMGCTSALILVTGKDKKVTKDQDCWCGIVCMVMVFCLNGDKGDAFIFTQKY